MTTATVPPSRWADLNPTEAALIQMLRTMLVELRWPDGEALTPDEAYWLGRTIGRIVRAMTHDGR